MQNLVTSSPWIWGSLLAATVALPILIHLINRMRHQPIEWAAMEFLLASFKRNRNQIWLKQWLLLLARIAMLLLALLTIGQVSCQHNGLTQLSGIQTTHHYLIVDDSLSMGEISNGKSAVNRASEVISLLANRLAGRENHRVTLVRFSTSTNADRKKQYGSEPKGDFDMSARVVDRATANELQRLATSLQATSLHLVAGPALEKVQRRIEQTKNETSVVYLLSDFRQIDWAQTNGVAMNKEAAETMARIDSLGATINLIRCADQANGQLAIVDLKPISTITVAGVPAMMEVHVKNFGEQVARQIQVRVDSGVYPDQQVQNTAIKLLEPERMELSTVLFDEIKAGATASRQFPVYFNQTGQHALQVSLPDDALPGDNRRWSVTNFSLTEKVLIVDGSEDNSGSLLALALAPGKLTGLEIQQTNKSTLRDSTLDQLAQYETIFLTDVDQLDPVAVTRLEQFVESGGGVVFFLGPRVNPVFYRDQLYRSGQGLFPAPLRSQAIVDEALQPISGDFVPLAHPIFDAVNNVENSPLALVQIRMHFQIDNEWSADNDESVSVIANVRGDSTKPLVIEKQLGKGHVIAVLTTAGTRWNNWLRNPTYPPTMLLLQNHVASGRADHVQRAVGWSKEIALPTAEFETTVNFVAPSDDDGFARTSFLVKAKNGTDPPLVTVGSNIKDTGTAGVYEVWKTKRDQSRVLDRFALNVDVAESDLKIADRGELQRAVEATNANVIDWGSFGSTRTKERGNSLLRTLLFVLVGLFLTEQWLAYLNSYHPRKR